MEVLIENLQDNVAITDKLEALLKEAVNGCLRLQEFQMPSEISIMLVDDSKIKEINKEQRNIDKATDVLSFPMVDMKDGEIISNEGDFDLDENLLLLGDIIISTDTAMKQAEEYGHSFEREMAFLVTHGVFHLLGFDHEVEEEERVMMGKQESVLKGMGLER